jgi:hypothetical protein
VKQGWTDSLRELNPGKRMYTFWHYMRHRWERDAGLRLEHLLLSPALAKRLEDGGVDRQVRGKPHASDHAPAWVTLRDQTGAPAGSAAARAVILEYSASPTRPWRWGSLSGIGSPSIFSPRATTFSVPSGKGR